MTPRPRITSPAAKHVSGSGERHERESRAGRDTGRNKPTVRTASKGSILLQRLRLTKP